MLQILINMMLRNAILKFMAFDMLKIMLLSKLIQMLTSKNIEIITYFSKKYVGEPFLNPFITYSFMKISYTVLVIDLRLHFSLRNLQEIRLFERLKNLAAAILFDIVFRQKENKIVSDGNEIQFFKRKLLV